MNTVERIGIIAVVLKSLSNEAAAECGQTLKIVCNIPAFYPACNRSIWNRWSPDTHKSKSEVPVSSCTLKFKEKKNLSKFSLSCYVKSEE